MSNKTKQKRDYFDENPEASIVQLFLDSYNYQDRDLLGYGLSLLSSLVWKRLCGKEDEHGHGDITNALPFNIEPDEYWSTASEEEQSKAYNRIFEEAGQYHYYPDIPVYERVGVDYK